MTHTQDEPARSDAAVWDERYSEKGDDQALWSGEPNGVLTVETAGLHPIAALDVGCGEGADAIWLAEQGWRVTAVDPSGVAIDRAQRAAQARGVEVEWVTAGITEAPAGPFDLVAAIYPALRHDAAETNLAAVLDRVAVLGTLLFVHHAVVHRDPEEHGFDPGDYLMPHEVAQMLTNEWTIEVFEERERVDAPPDSRHPRDVVLRAIRTA